jgi:hypothetical protein
MEIPIATEKGILVIAGGWNANILLNPEWLGRYMFPGQGELQVEFRFGPQFSAPSVSAGDVRIALEGPKLSFIPLKTEPGILDYIEELGTKVADYLPHTPVSAVGINFIVEVAAKDGPAPTGEEEIASRTKTALQEFGQIVEEIHRYAVSLETCTLNLAIRQPAKERRAYDFNFHHSVKSLADFKELISENPIAQYKTKAEGILDALVGVGETEGENRDGNE